MEEKRQRNQAPEKPKKPGWKKYVLSFAVLAALTALTFWYLLKDYDLAEIGAAFRSADWRYLALAAGMIALYLAGETLAQYVMLRSLGAKTSIAKNFKYTSADFYFSAITPGATGGQPMVAYFMAKDGAGMAPATLTLLLNTIMYKIVLLLLGIVALAVRPSVIFGSGPVVISLFFVGIAINVALIALMFAAIFAHAKIERLGKKCIRLLSRMHILKDTGKAEASFGRMLESYREGAAYIRTHLRMSVKMFLYNLIQRGGLFSVAWFVYRSFGLSGTDYWYFMALQVTVALSVDSMLLPGGVVLSENIILSMYSRVYPERLMMPAMILTRAITYYSMLILTSVVVFAAFGAIAFNNRKKGKEGS